MLIDEKHSEKAVSDSPAADFLVGIDLGTTHTVVAYSPIRESADASDIRIFDIEQLVAPGEVAALPLLPSFRYHALEGEIAPGDCVLPWSGREAGLPGELPQVIIGEWARELGSKVDGRLVSSAKSWLSHPQVDRRADILPWSAADGVVKVSPVLASASYLAYVRNAWNHRFPDALLERQQVVITLPASFDEGARALTIEAARLAGLENIMLLEEPQAACYDWFARHSEGGGDAAHMQLLMVCDVGGGTTDLSLIRVERDGEDQLRLSRIAVGDHLMLGGDNVDFALTRIAEQRLGLARKLSAAQLSQLIQQSRQAKERLLSAEPAETATVTLLGSGSRLIGGAKTCQLTRSDVDQIALEGFLPLTALDELPARRRSAVVEMGLPYASEPAISKHLAAFIQGHRQACCEATGLSLDSDQPALPDGLLLNGGVFNSPRLSARVRELLGRWRGDDRLVTLENQHPDLAVACGAVAYAMARRSGQRRIGGGSARTFFLGLDSREPQQEHKGICLLPKGSEENIEVRLERHRFQLTLDQPVRFTVFSSSADDRFNPGDLVPIGADFVQLPPLVAALEAGDSNSGDGVPVQLIAQLTEVGTLQLDCVGLDSAKGQRWRVEFQLRESGGPPQESAASLPAKWPAAKDKIELIFGASKRKLDPKNVKSLRNDLEKLLGKRDTWDVNILRAIFDQLLAGIEQRRRSVAHERVWLNLGGFALRPGFGDPADAWRIEQIWPLFSAGLHYPSETQSWIDWWTFWRRAAGGLDGGQQRKVFDEISPYIDPANLKRRKLQAELKTKSYEDIVRLAAALEDLSGETKVQLGDWFLERLSSSSETLTSWWALGRVGSRVPFHGSVHNVIPKAVVERWLEQLLARKWAKNSPEPFAAVMLGRLSGDRSRDIDDDLRERVIARLEDIKSPDSWLAMMRSAEALGEQETKRVFGEALPSGLQLIK